MPTMKGCGPQNNNPDSGPATATHGSMMMTPTPPVIEIHGGEVTVAASYLSARLGLSVDRLRKEMRRRLVYSVVERGVGEDAGRLRLTFRYRARSWTVVVQPDGTLLSEEPRPQDTGDH